MIILENSEFSFLVFMGRIMSIAVSAKVVLIQLSVTIKKSYCPGWCGSVDWVSFCKPKGHWFDSQSRHMPGWLARSPVRGMQEATD